MTADIAFGQRTVDRIAQRVDADIGVGVSGQAFVVWDLYAAQKQGPTFLKGVHVESGAGAGDKACGKHAFEARQIVGIGDLDVVLRSFDDHHTLSHRFQQRRIIGRIGCVRAMGCENRRISERLRRLGTIQAGARHGSGYLPIVNKLQRVGDRLRPGWRPAPVPARAAAPGSHSAE